MRQYYNIAKVIIGYLRDKSWNAESYYPEMTRKSQREIIKDNIRFILKHGYVNPDYFAYGFDVKGVDMNEYYSGEEFCALRNLASGRLGKKPNYTCLLENKELFELVAKSKNLKAAYTLGYYRGGGIFSELQTLFENFLNEKPHLFLKTSTSEKGKGAFSVDYDKEHNQYYLNDKPSDLRIIQETLDSVGQDFLVQQRLIQHKELNRLYPHSLNTIRVVSVIENNEVYIINALLRCGTDGRVVDNASQGGVFVGINDDGTLMQYGYYYPEFGTKTDEHPDTKVAFASITIPYYKEVLNLVKEAHHAFNRTKTVGWDVAVLEDGPILIEGNSCWAERIVQICCGGIKKKMDKYLKQ